MSSHPRHFQGNISKQIPPPPHTPVISRETFQNKSRHPLTPPKLPGFINKKRGIKKKTCKTKKKQGKKQKKNRNLI